jgi:hypothetical protein
MKNNNVLRYFRKLCDTCKKRSRCWNWFNTSPQRIHISHLLHVCMGKGVGVGLENSYMYIRLYSNKKYLFILESTTVIAKIKGKPRSLQHPHVRDPWGIDPLHTLVCTSDETGKTEAPSHDKDPSHLKTPKRRA